MRSNTTVSLMSTVFYTVSFFFCSLWKFLLKPAKNKVLCKDVRFFETWNALINRLDEINLTGLSSLWTQRTVRGSCPTEWKTAQQNGVLLRVQASLLTGKSHNEQSYWVSLSHTHTVKNHSAALLFTVVSLQDLSSEEPSLTGNLQSSSYFQSSACYVPY